VLKKLRRKRTRERLSKKGVKKIFKIAKRQRRNLRVDEALQVVQSYGIPIVESNLVRTAEAAVAFAENIGYPVAMKIVSDALHKTDIGGVALNLRSEADVHKAYRKLVTNARRHRLRLGGILVQRMVDGCEAIVGGKKDAQFGQAIVFGLGGIFVEVFADVALRVVPITKKDAQEMIKEIKGFKILAGYRGRAYDLDALMCVLLNTSKLLEKNDEIKELDINPLFALRKGAVAVDARIILE